MVCMLISFVVNMQWTRIDHSFSPHIQRVVLPRRLQLVLCDIPHVFLSVVLFIIRFFVFSESTSAISLAFTFLHSCCASLFNIKPEEKEEERRRSCCSFFSSTTSCANHNGTSSRFGKFSKSTHTSLRWSSTMGQLLLLTFAINVCGRSTNNGHANAGETIDRCLRVDQHQSGEILCLGEEGVEEMVLPCLLSSWSDHLCVHWRCHIQQNRRWLRSWTKCTIVFIVVVDFSLKCLFHSTANYSNTSWADRQYFRTGGARPLVVAQSFSNANGQ